MEVRTLTRNHLDFQVTTQEWFEEIDYVGNIELIKHPLLAIFSSEKCSASLILRAHDFAKGIRNGELGVVSGFHAPAEKEVLEVFLKGSCPIIVVLGRRLENARIAANWQSEIEKGRMLIISPFKEYQTYVTKKIAVKRNNLAARIAGRVLIVHASDKGSLENQMARWKLDGIKIDLLS